MGFPSAFLMDREVVVTKELITPAKELLFLKNYLLSQAELSVNALGVVFTNSKDHFVEVFGDFRPEDKKTANENLLKYREALNQEAPSFIPAALGLCLQYARVHKKAKERQDLTTLFEKYLPEILSITDSSEAFIDIYLACYYDPIQKIIRDPKSTNEKPWHIVSRFLETLYLTYVAEKRFDDAYDILQKASERGFIGNWFESNQLFIQNENSKRGIEILSEILTAYKASNIYSKGLEASIALLKRMNPSL